VHLGESNPDEDRQREILKLSTLQALREVVLSLNLRYQAGPWALTPTTSLVGLCGSGFSSPAPPSGIFPESKVLYPTGSAA